MNISPVSFRSAAAPSFQDIINKPQAFTTATPSAATNINEGGAKKGSGAKKVLGLLVAAGAIAAGLAVGAKKGKFTVGETTNKYLAKVFPWLEKAGNAVNGAVDKVVELAKKILPKAKDIAE